MARPITDQQILDAALDVIIQRGYAGATTARLQPRPASTR